MSKRIVLLSDGTGNSNIKRRGTNVFKIYEAIDFNLSDPNGQIAFYDDGVGSQEYKILKILGGAFGWGLARNVRHLYKELVQSYEPGDKIYLFGFSRGAFTVRTLAGLVTSMGLLKNADYPKDSDLDLAVLELYEQYRARELAVLESLIYKPFMKGVYVPLRKHWGKTAGLVSDNRYSDVPIEFIGVWDTVDAVGLPFQGMTDFWNKYVFRFKFSNKDLNQKVRKGCHALSIDDQRRSFHPLLWTEREGIEQVWFPGVHANVGGGYPQQGLSLVSLEWMMEKAKATDLDLKFVDTDLKFARDRKNVYDKLYDSRSGLGVYYRYQPRDIAAISAVQGISTPKIHLSAFQRIAQGVLGYAPGNLPQLFEVVDNAGTHSSSETILHLVTPRLPESNDAILLSTLPIRKLIAIRHGLYYAFIAYSALTLCWLMQEDYAKAEGGVLSKLFAVAKVLVSPDGLLDKIGALLWDNPLLVLIGAALYFASVHIRGQLQWFFSEFWSTEKLDLGANLRTRLRSLISR